MSNKPKSIGVNYVYNLIYQILALVVPFILTPYVARVLSPEGIGEFSYTTTIVGYFVLAGNLGIATYGQLEVAKTRNDPKKCSKMFWEILLTRFITMSISLFIYMLYVIFGHSMYTMMYRVLIVQIVASALDISWLLQGLEEFKKIVLRNVIIKISGVILVLLFVREEGDLYKYALLMNGVILLGNMSLWTYVPKFLTSVKMAEFRVWTHLKQSFVYFIPSIATTLYLTLDKTMIEWFSTTTAENGYYEQAQKIEQMAVTAVTSLSVVTMPRMALLFNEKKNAEMRHIFGKTIRFVLFLSIPMCVGFISVADIFIPIYLGSGYETSAVLLKIFSFLLVIVGLNNAFGKQILIPLGKQKKYNIGVIIGALVNFSLNLILIPRLLSVGAAIASVIAEGVILIVFMLFSKEFYNGFEVIKLAKNYIVASIVMAILIKFISIWLDEGLQSLIIQILTGGVAYLLSLFFMRDALVFEGLTLMKKKFSKVGGKK